MTLWLCIAYFISVLIAWGFALASSDADTWGEALIALLIACLWLLWLPVLLGAAFADRAR